MPAQIEHFKRIIYRTKVFFHPFAFRLSAEVGRQSFKYMLT